MIMDKRKIKVVRVLHPIGQGAFYTEQFECNGCKRNIVFDCGGTKGHIEREVLYYCSYLSIEQGKEKPIVDAVFISHFDDDRRPED